ncbi:Proteasome-associated ATPase [Defluviimonas aquaemixtae]|uniref:Proteasome-associated ATPase n=1 Tax=Albidovulum aquaemixtae TaxID=1542388 RepID=A0A2R8BKM9_9RHOB|nr:Proteasome-associated ATPase [Defluviimonas aquaemixtae]
MALTRTFIGPFRRRAFADGLRALLEDDPNLSVTALVDPEDVERHLAADQPTVLILEDRAGENEVHPLPRSPFVAVILVSSEGTDVQIALNQLDSARLRDAIGLAEQTAHPKVISLSDVRPVQPPLALPHFRHGGESALRSVTDWLDAAFALALDRLVAARGGDAGGWSGDLAALMAGFGAADTSEEARLFGIMLETPLWQQRLFRTFALEPAEVRAICLAAAPDLDQRYAWAYGLLQNNYAEPRPSGSTLAHLLDPDLVGAEFTALVTGRRLFARYGLVRPAPAPADRAGEPQPGYRAAPAILDLMLGKRPRGGGGWWLQAAALPALAELTADLERLFTHVADPVATIAPGAHDGAEEVAAALLAIGRPVLRADAWALESEEKLIDLALHARLHDAVLLLEGLDQASDAARSLCLSTDLQGLVDGLVLDGVASAPKAARATVALNIGRVEAEDRKKRWAFAMRDNGLGSDEETSAGLAARLRFRLSDIRLVAELAAGRRRAGDTSDTEDLMLEAARHVSIRHAPATVRRPPLHFDWTDLVLPERIEAQVKAVPTHVVNGPTVLDHWGYSRRLSYGRGVGALFCGASGTGKTMSAQVIARALGVDLMQVELSRCVSKYIGETEKNIDACFRAADAASACLLFDEADAMFGKRTQIKDAHDRHANVEVAYLLQRIEAYEGLVILTSNLKANIDPAFLRRLRFVIDFPFPNAAERQMIWERAIPDTAPCAEDLDVAFLARRLELSGGSIQQIAVNAAFAAASDGGVIEMRHVMAATRAELIKMGQFTAERALEDPPSRALITRGRA